MVALRRGKYSGSSRQPNSARAGKQGAGRFFKGGRAGEPGGFSRADAAEGWRAFQGRHGRGLGGFIIRAPPDETQSPEKTQSPGRETKPPKKRARIKPPSPLPGRPKPSSPRRGRPKPPDTLPDRPNRPASCLPARAARLNNVNATERQKNVPANVQIVEKTLQKAKLLLSRGAMIQISRYYYIYKVAAATKMIRKPPEVLPKRYAPRFCATKTAKR